MIKAFSLNQKRLSAHIIFGISVSLNLDNSRIPYLF
nr:MAG TPA: hypothetical protein [Caudoviricetes sp.]